MNGSNWLFDGMSAATTCAPILIASLPWLGAAILAALPSHARRAAAWAAGATALFGLALVLAIAPAVFDGQIARWRVDWVPAIGLALGFRIDGLAWLFALLINAIGALVVLYGAYYLSFHDSARRFYILLLLFMGAMLGIVLADNLILLVVFWETTSLASFLLIGYWHDRSDAREGARMALTITGAGGLALLGGMLLLGKIAGGYDLDHVLTAGDTIRADPMYLPALLLILLGSFSKSAQFPFHFWLPHAMAAPTPVSAYLHSATMVKAGVFLLARLYPALGHSEPWFWVVTSIGLATLLLGAYVALFEHDLKGLLAYSTISHLGLITMLFGLDEPLAVVAGVFHILNHATFKASLFMAAGIIDHETGTRDMRRLNGLWRAMPRTGALAMVAAAAMAGVPLLNGFLSKEMFFAEAIAKEAHRPIAWLLPVGATIAGVFSVAYSTRFIHDVFFNGAPVGLTKAPHEPPRFMRVPVEILVLLCVAVGVWPSAMIGPLLAVSAQAALGAPLPQYNLAIWHGLNQPLLMSAIALAGGALLYFGLQRWVNLHRIVDLPLWIKQGGRDLFRVGQRAMIRSAGATTNALQSGSLQRYLFLLFATAIAAAALPFVEGARVRPGALPPQPASPVFIVLWAIGIAAALATLAAHAHRLLALVLLGAVGLIVSLCFVYMSAPDLALTQLLVEMATIVLMMLALHWLAPRSPAEGAPFVRNPRQWRDAVLATVVGGGMAALAYLILTRPFGATGSISPYFLETALTQGGGANVVNVILVDYRGFDTLGEITVLGVAGIVIYALLHGFAPKLPPRHGEAEGARHPLMLALAARALLPLATLVSIYLFLRGHNRPGGGFIAGLVMAIALILLYVANGRRWVEAHSAGEFRGWIGWGLTIAGLTGAGSWWFANPFLTSTYAYPNFPLIGPVPLASAALFDFGVYLSVVGSTMVALTAIGRLGPRHRDQS